MILRRKASHVEVEKIDKFKSWKRPQKHRPGFLSKSTLAPELSYNIWIDRVLAPPPKSLQCIFPC